MGNYARCGKNKVKVKCIVTSVVHAAALSSTWHSGSPSKNVPCSHKSLFPPMGDDEFSQPITRPLHVISLILFTWVHATNSLRTWNKLLWLGAPEKQDNLRQDPAAVWMDPHRERKSALIHSLPMGICVNLLPKWQSHLKMRHMLYTCVLIGQQ